MLKSYLNMSQVCLNLNNPKATSFYCEKILCHDLENLKALLRYGSSLRLLKEFDKSLNYFLRASNANPSSEKIAKETPYV